MPGLELPKVSQKNVNNLHFVLELLVFCHFKKEWDLGYVVTALKYTLM